MDSLFPGHNFVLLHRIAVATTGRQKFSAYFYCKSAPFGRTIVPRSARVPPKKAPADKELVKLAIEKSKLSASPPNGQASTSAPARKRRGRPKKFSMPRRSRTNSNTANSKEEEEAQTQEEGEETQVEKKRKRGVRRRSSSRQHRRSNSTDETAIDAENGDNEDDVDGEDDDIPFVQLLSSNSKDLSASTSLTDSSASDQGGDSMSMETEDLAPASSSSLSR